MKNIKVLIVDDEEEFAETLADRLRLRDLEPETVHNGEQALSFVKDNEPDVILLDLKMPGMDGMEVLKRVKKAYPNIEVVMLTGHGTEEDKEKAKELGAFDYLEKPVDIGKLMTQVKKAFQGKIDKTMVAATFAEMGDFETARKMIEKEDD